jgi:hypothetical protein
MYFIALKKKIRNFIRNWPRKTWPLTSIIQTG